VTVGVVLQGMASRWLRVPLPCVRRMGARFLAGVSAYLQYHWLCIAGLQVSLARCNTTFDGRFNLD